MENDSLQQQPLPVQQPDVLSVFNNANTDIILLIIQYLNVIDSGRFAATCRRHYYLVHQFQSTVLSAELVASTSIGETTYVDDDIDESVTATPSAAYNYGRNLHFNNNNRQHHQRKRSKYHQHQQQLDSDTVCTNAIRKLRTKPKFGLGFCTSGCDLPLALTRHVPTETVLLCSRSRAIQSSGIVSGIPKSSRRRQRQRRRHSNEQDSNFTTNGYNAATTKKLTECDSESGLLLSSFQQVQHIVPFKTCRGSVGPVDQTQFEHPSEWLRYMQIIDDPGHNNNNEDDEAWKSTAPLPKSITQCPCQDFTFFIVYGVGERGEYETDAFVRRLQHRYPNATIVGGICDDAYISVPIEQTVYGQYSGATDFCNNLTRETMADLYQCLGGKNPRMLNDPMSVASLGMGVACNELVKRKKFVLQYIDNGICGIGFAGGNVPVHAIVSRGVTSRTETRTSTTDEHPAVAAAATATNTTTGTRTAVPVPTKVSLPTLTSAPILFSRPSLYVLESRYVTPNDNEYIFEIYEDYTPSYHCITLVQDRTTSRIYTISQLLGYYGTPDYIGIQRYSDGYELEQMDQYTSDYIIVQSYDDDNRRCSNPIGSLDDSKSTWSRKRASRKKSKGTSTNSRTIPSLIGCKIDLFDLDGQACVQHVDESMVCLQQQLVGKELLGGIMFSCTGRGPYGSNHLVQEDMVDAKRFAGAFPQVPCLGFYAGGELGPIAIANSHDTTSTSTISTGSVSLSATALRQDQSTTVLSSPASPYSVGKARLQGFTVVWAVFVVPTPDENTLGSTIDDSAENIQDFIQHKLTGTIYDDKPTRSSSSCWLDN